MEASQYHTDASIGNDQDHPLTIPDGLAGIRDNIWKAAIRGGLTNPFFPAWSIERLFLVEGQISIKSVIADFFHHYG